jgi:hypothetical protein
MKTLKDMGEFDDFKKESKWQKFKKLLKRKKIIPKQQHDRHWD